VRLVVGSGDTGFAAIAEDLARRLPRARVERIPDAGHAAHLENPRAFLRLARRVIAEVDAAESNCPQPPEIRSAQPMRDATR
jgi:pimeloyl-ACP methyl ester carboxylesterase